MWTDQQEEQREGEVSVVRVAVTGRSRWMGRDQERTERGEEKIRRKSKERSQGGERTRAEENQERTIPPPSAPLSVFMIISSSCPLYQRVGNLQHQTQVEMMNGDGEQRKDAD